MRILLLTLGYLSLGLGIMGIFLPLVPTTPFLLVAVYSFSRSNKKLHQWLLHHRYLGPPVRDWQNGGVIRMRIKACVLPFLALGLIMVWLKTSEVFVAFRVLVTLPMLIIAVFIASRPSRSPGHTSGIQ